MQLTKKFIGDKAFYKMVLAVAVPMMIQNGITNFVSLLDNIMVGKLGTEQMSGVSIVNQFIFIFNLLIFGAVSAAGIFTAQYYGKGDTDGVRHTFRFKFLVNIAVAVVSVVAFMAFSDELIGLFLHETDSEGDLALTLKFGKEYLLVMLIGLLPYAVSQVYASTMRETGDTVMPMLASLIAVFANCILNLVLIFGYLGLPAMGVVGAAVATVTSRFIELIFLVVAAHRNPAKFPYLKGAYASLAIPRRLFSDIFKKGIPIMLNEFLWAVAMMMRNQCYSTRGLDVVAAQNISSTLFNVFSVVYLSVGASIGIIVGKLLGAKELERAKDTSTKMIAFSIFSSVLIAGLLIATAYPFPLIYNTTGEVRSLATYMMIVSALSMPFCAFANAAYFSIRSGGKVMVTILFDSVFMWAFVIPLSAVLAYLTPIPIMALFAICQMTEGVKMLFGLILLKKVNWVKQLDVIENDA